MYGLVNSSLKDFVTLHHGEAMWHKVRARAAVQESEFVTMQTYPDEVSYALVAAAQAELGVELDAFLHGLGEHWVEFAASRGHGAMLSSAGRGLVELLQNLDAMHARIALTFPELRPPSFRVRGLTSHSLELHYYSHRPGLLPFVEGLLSGLAKRFAVAIEVRVLERREHDADHDVLQVRWEGSQP